MMRIRGRLQSVEMFSVVTGRVTGEVFGAMQLLLKSMEANMELVVFQPSQGIQEKKMSGVAYGIESSWNR